MQEGHQRNGARGVILCVSLPTSIVVDMYMYTCTLGNLYSEVVVELEVARVRNHRLCDMSAQIRAQVINQPFFFWGGGVMAELLLRRVMVCD